MSWPGRRVRLPFEAAALECVARGDRVVEAERIGALVELRHPRALRRPRLDVLRFARGNRDAAAVGVRDRGVAAHVVGVAMGVDEALERLAVEALGAREELERLLAMGAVARVDEHVVARREHHDLVAVEPAAHDDAHG